MCEFYHKIGNFDKIAVRGSMQVSLFKEGNAMSYVHAIVAFAIIFLLYKAAEGNYRNHIPRERNLLEANFEKRIFPEGRTEYYFHDSCANWFERVFIERDIKYLSKEGVGLVSEYCRQDGSVIEETVGFAEELRKYADRCSRAYMSHEGRVPYEVRMKAPYAYIRQCYKIKN